jgi:integrase
MPVKERHKTNYAGVYYIIGESAKGPERIYYIRYKIGGRLIENKVGRQFRDDMTPAKASGIRARRLYGQEVSNREKRILSKAESDKWTVTRLWQTYKENKVVSKSIRTEEYRYQKHLEKSFGNKEPANIIQLDVDRLRITLGRKLRPQTVKHILNLLDRIINHGLKKGLIDQGLKFKIQKPRVDNIKTEDLSEEQLRKLLTVIDTEEDIQIRNIVKLALFTGMRRGEIFKLQWDDLDFRRELITIRDPKGGRSQVIPMNSQAKNLLTSHPQGESPYVFPAIDGEKRTTIQVPLRRIRARAGLPKDFRPLHGLRHVFASMLASSGQVDMYTLQKLLTHKSPIMTQRYAHLRDEALKRASSVAGDLLSAIVNPSDGVAEFEEIESDGSK